MRRICLAVVAALLLSLGAAAEPYPHKAIRFVVPFAPGGTSEIIARSIAQELTTQLGVSVYVENKAGGASTIAMTDVAKSPPDGYTLVMGHVGSLAVNPFAMDRQPYDVNKDFIPVALLARVPNIFVLNAENVPAKDFREFIALAKAKPGQLNYGSAGNGSAGHLAFEYLKMVTDTEITHVPYRGTGPQLQDLLGGRLDATSAGTSALIPRIKIGNQRSMDAGRHARIAGRPDVPNAATLGYSGFEASPKAWRGGNTQHTRNLRCAHDAPEDVLTEAYPEPEYWEDLQKVTAGRTNERLARMTLAESARLRPWMRAHGVVFQPSLGGTLQLSRTNAIFLRCRQALVDAYYRKAASLGIEVRYETEAL